MPALACLAAVGLIAAAEGSEPAPPPRDTAGEIVVTGERAARTLRETPSSVVVFTADELDAQPGSDRLDGILETVPNIQFGGGTQGPTIRGLDTTGVLQDLPAFLGGTRPRVTLQVDGRSISYSEFVSGVAPLWDVERVEVFRSPQSTTQGRNSIAGAIFVYTKDPTYQWEGRARLIHGGLATSQASVFVSGPIVGDQLAFRLSGDARTSANPNKVVNSAVVGANPNRDRYGVARAKLLAEPAALPGFRLEASYVYQKSRQAPAEGIIQPFEKRRGSRGGAVSDNESNSLTAEARYDVTERLRLSANLSAGRIDNQRFAPAGLGETLTDIRDHSIEILLDWQPSDRMKARFGTHQLRTRLDQFIDLTAVLGVGDFVDYQRNFGLFGEAELKPATNATLTAGLRFQRDRQTRRGTLGNPVFPTLVDFDRTFEAWLPKLVLSVDILDRVTAGVLVQRAYNPGGVAINFDTTRQVEFGEESLWSYELFGRATLSDGRLWLTANLFRNDFRDSQRAEQRAFTVPGGNTAFWALIFNLPHARSQGLEGSLDWAATNRLRLRGSVGLLGTRIDEEAGGPFAGNRFGRAPRFSGTASFEWRPLDRLRLDADVRHHSGYFSDDLNTPAFRINKATVVDARADYELGRVSLSAYVRNLLDSFYLTSQFSSTFATAGDPREIGVGIDARF